MVVSPVIAKPPVRASVPVPFLVSALSQMTNGPVVIVTAPVGGWALPDATWKVSNSLSSWPKAILGENHCSGSFRG